MPETQAEKEIREGLFAAFEEMNEKAMDPNLPIPEREAALKQAEDLRDKWVKLEAARFNSEAQAFRDAQKEVAGAITDLRRAMKDLDDMVKIAETASKVFGLLDKLLLQAAKFV